jgi:outer membrane receptor protein involved in Fe transport
VAVVTAAQIERRGYLDLEEIFHDLPGFDVARSNGEVYSNLNPRGFRATNNDRMLLLVDGVEQNDLSSGAAPIARQYSLLDIDRVEVLYGPASALYGAEAYGGVINVVTRPPEAFLEPGESYGGRVAVTAGGLDTKAADFTLAGRLKDQSLAWSLTGRLHQSSEPDLSRYADWDYRYDVDYGEALRLTGQAARSFAQSAPASPFYTVVHDAGGAVVAVVPTAEGERLAAALDRSAQESLPAFSDTSEDWSLSGKVRIKNLVLGFQTWRREEGTASAYTELARAGRGNVWTPAQTAFYVNYYYPASKDLQVRFGARYRQSGLNSDGTSVAAFRTYFSGGLDLGDLVRCAPDGQNSACRRGELLPVEHFSQLSTQVTGELSLVYDSPRKWLSAIGGADVRIGSIQSDLGSLTSQSPPAEHTNIGLFTQATFSPQRERWKSLRLVAAGRLDFNRIDTLVAAKAGYGTAFSPRLAAIYEVTRDVFVKALYARGIREPTDLERFATDQRETPGGSLRPETVDNFELGAGWHLGKGAWADGVTVEAAGYRAEHRDLLRPQATGRCLRPVELVCEPETRLRNLGSLRTEGGSLTLSAELRSLKVFGNYTYTDTRDPDPLDDLGNPLVDAQGRRITELRLADLARHRANLGFNVDLHSNWSFDVRLNYASARGTSGSAGGISSSLLTHAAASWRAPRLPELTFQLAVRNLFDERTADPGLQLAVRGIARSIPQPGRTLYLRISYQRQKHHVRP